MIKSMTGFGRSEYEDEGRKVTVEMKAVNHRYGEINIRMPKVFGSFEAPIRTLLKDYIQRGKVDIFISYEDHTENQKVLKYNRELAAEYMECFKEMAEEFSLKNDICVSQLSRYPEVLTMEEQSMDEDRIWEMLQKAVKEAAGQFVETRIAEGAHLKADLTGKLDEMLAMVAFIEERSPEILREYREKLEDKVKEMLADSTIEENRIAAEVILYADKICVDEETVRLKSHIESMKQALEAQGSTGRKLDFIAQEMNREANTILSKANDLEISNKAIDLKTEIEKVREQIQNIE